MVFNTTKGQSTIDNENKYEIKRKCIMCNCWHKNDSESMAMWDKYHPRNSGIAIKTTMEKLKESLTDTIDVYIGDIKYMSHESIKGGAILPIQKGNDSNSFQFENLASLSSASLCYPYFFKRKAFEYEHEVRIIIDIESIMGDVFEKLKDVDFSNLNIIASKFPEISDQGRAYDVDVNTLVEEVIISPYAEPWIENTVRLIVQKYGFKFDVKSSTLLDLP